MAVDKMKCKVYTLTDPITSEIRYIGQTIKNLDDRLRTHMKEAKNHLDENSYRLNWIRSLLKRGLLPIIELLEDNATWNETEIYWISQFRSWNFNLVNRTDGGDGTIGLRRSIESKLKSSKSRKKYLLTNTMSEETREKIKRTRKKSIYIVSNINETLKFEGGQSIATFLNCRLDTVYRVISGKRKFNVKGYKIVKL